MWGVFCEFKVRFSHSIARPWGLGGGCLLWVQSRIYVLLFSNAIFNHIITAPDCIKTLFLAIGISIIQGRWSWTHLTFIMLIIILVKLHLLSSWTKCLFCRPYLHMNLFNWNVCIVIENFSLTINQHYFSSFGHFCHGLLFLAGHWSDSGGRHAGLRSTCSEEGLDRQQEDKLTVCSTDQRAQGHRQDI